MAQDRPYEGLVDLSSEKEAEVLYEVFDLRIDRGEEMTDMTYMYENVTSLNLVDVAGNQVAVHDHSGDIDTPLHLFLEVVYDHGRRRAAHERHRVNGWTTDTHEDTEEDEDLHDQIIEYLELQWYKGRYNDVTQKEVADELDVSTEEIREALNSEQ